MAGKIRQLLDRVIDQRSQGDAILAITTTTRIILRGVDPARFDANSEDDPMILERVRDMALEFGIPEALSRQGAAIRIGAP